MAEEDDPRLSPDKSEKTQSNVVWLYPDKPPIDPNGDLPRVALTVVYAKATDWDIERERAQARFSPFFGVMVQAFRIGRMSPPWEYPNSNSKRMGLHIFVILEHIFIEDQLQKPENSWISEGSCGVPYLDFKREKRAEFRALLEKHGFEIVTDRGNWP